jgi:SAM-dependent methyltransferase
MSGLSHANPTGRFTGLAGLYAQCRPGYPAAALDWIMTHCGLRQGSVLIDVGCGTGISSRLFAQRGLRVLGVEPNADMRARAEAEPVPPDVPAPVYHAGHAEATNLASSIADAVLAAQAFHWFEPDRALREFHRLLRPGGWVVLLWNERDESDPFTAEYGAAVRSTPDAAKVEGPRARAGEPLLTCPLFQNAERVAFANEQTLEEEGLLGRSFSASYAPREPDQVEAFAKRLREIFARHQQDGRVVLRLETSAYVARRPQESGVRGQESGVRNSY